MNSLQYQIKRSSRKTLAIYVHRDQRIEVRAPYRVSKRFIDQFVSLKTPWVQRQQQHFATCSPPLQLAYHQSAQHQFLGESVKLVLTQANKLTVQYQAGELHIALPQLDCTAKVETSLFNWFRQQAKGLFTERVHYWYQEMEALGFALPSLGDIRIRKMKRQWGSCSKTGDITLNLWLITQPRQHIDYVIVHELCHLLEFNHSKRFYQLLDNIFPHWQECKQGLAESPYPPH